MSVYRGVVKGNVVLLPEGAELADGATVEVRPITSSNAAEPLGAAELRFRQRLIATGLLAEPVPPQPRTVEDRTPVRVQGQPLSEDIPEARR